MKIKKTKIIWLSLFLLGIICLLFIVICPNDKTITPTEIETEDKAEESYELISIQAPEQFNNILTSATIIPNETFEVKMKVTGVVDKKNNTLNIGDSFKKGEILIKLERTEILYSLLATRTNFKNLVQEALVQIEEELPSELDKWMKFEKNIDRTKLLPSFPEITSNKEIQLLMELDILTQYRTVQETEELAEEHFYVAPFDGFIVSSKIQAESNIEKDTPILTIAKSNSLIASANININNKFLKEHSTFTYTNSKGDTIGTGSLLKDQIDTTTVLFSLDQQKPTLTNQTIKILLPAKVSTIKIPTNSLAGDTVYLFKNDQIIKLPVEVLNRSEQETEVINSFGPCSILRNVEDIK